MDICNKDDDFFSKNAENAIFKKKLTSAKFFDDVSCTFINGILSRSRVPSLISFYSLNEKLLRFSSRQK